jgi:ubiquinone/menaquinone biosynthesis C-methylase UbiE
MTFWDFCAPFYDLSMKANGKAYEKMLTAIQELVPYGASVIEVAAGTGAISISISHRANNILCTDFSKQMIKVAQRKAEKQKYRILPLT